MSLSINISIMPDSQRLIGLARHRNPKLRTAPKDQIVTASDPGLGIDILKKQALAKRFPKKDMSPVTEKKS